MCLSFGGPFEYVEAVLSFYNLLIRSNSTQEDVFTVSSEVPQ